MSILLWVLFVFGVFSTGVLCGVFLMIRYAVNHQGVDKLILQVAAKMDADEKPRTTGGYQPMSSTSPTLPPQAGSGVPV